MNTFKVIVPSFNSVEYIAKTLHSIEEQSYTNYDVCVIDDASTLKQQKEIIKDFCVRNGWKAIYHEKNYGALRSIIDGIQSLECKDDDVIVIVDGDDWLAHENALKHIHQVYAEKDIFLTWGQCEKYPAGNTPMKYAQPIPDMIIEQKIYRDIPFIFWHPLTFKYVLWRHIEDEDLRDINGEYFRIMYDKAILFPMLEMSGYKKAFLRETLYIYNLENPLNDYATTPREEHDRVNALLKKKKRYPLLDFCR